MLDWDREAQQVARVQRIQAFRLAGSFRMGGFARSGGRVSVPSAGRDVVVVRGSYRYLSGKNAKPNAAKRHSAHLRYLAGERADQIQKGTDRERQLFDSQGREISAAEASSADGAYIEHRLIVSPGGSALSDDDLHTHAQNVIRNVQERNPQAEIRAHYAIHHDTAHPHVHVNLTSRNQLKLTREDYQQLRQDVAELRHYLEQGRGREVEHNRSDEYEKHQQMGGLER